MHFHIITAAAGIQATHTHMDKHTHRYRFTHINITNIHIYLEERLQALGEHGNFEAIVLAAMLQL